MKEGSGQVHTTFAKVSITHVSKSKILVNKNIYVVSVRITFWEFLIKSNIRPAADVIHLSQDCIDRIDLKLRLNCI